MTMLFGCMFSGKQIKLLMLLTLPPRSKKGFYVALDFILNALRVNIACICFPKGF